MAEFVYEDISTVLKDNISLSTHDLVVKIKEAGFNDATGNNIQEHLSRAKEELILEQPVEEVI